MRYRTILVTIFILVFCVAANVYAEPKSDLIAQWQQLLDHTNGTYGIYLIDLNSGKTIGINELTPFHAASTIKLPINLYLYQQMAANKVSPSTLLTYKQKHYEGGTGYLQNKPLNSKFTIAELSQASITHSDNVATNMLYDYLGRNNVKSYMRQIGGVVVINDQNVTCPRDMALYMQEIKEFAVQYPYLGSTLLDHLEHNVFRERIPAGLPEKIKVANKIGDWPPTGTHNDVAYVFHPQNPYILAVLSMSATNRDEAYEVIRNISKITYAYQSQLK